MQVCSLDGTHFKRHYGVGISALAGELHQRNWDPHFAAGEGLALKKKSKTTTKTHQLAM